MPKKQTVSKTTEKTTKRTSAQWAATSCLLRNLEPDEMLDLFQKLYMLSPDNVKFIDAQFKSTKKGGLLEEYRKKIEEEFFPFIMNRDSFPRMGWIKKLIRDYRKGTEDLAGTMELMITFQEQGMEFTMQYGDINERFYDSLLSGMNDVIKMLTKDVPELFPAFGDRLLAIAQRVYGRVGWGYGDGMYEAVGEIYNFHGLDLQKSGDWKTGYQITVVEKK